MARKREERFGPHATYVGIDVGKPFPLGLCRRRRGKRGPEQEAREWAGRHGRAPPRSRPLARTQRHSNFVYDVTPGPSEKNVVRVAEESFHTYALRTRLLHDIFDI